MRDLNPRSSAWQADALPTKLMPHIPRLSGVSNNDFWLGGVYCLLVLVAGLEPARYRYHGIFLPLYVTIALISFISYMDSHQGLFAYLK